MCSKSLKPRRRKLSVPPAVTDYATVALHTLDAVASAELVARDLIDLIKEVPRTGSFAGSYPTQVLLNDYGLNFTVRVILNRLRNYIDSIISFTSELTRLMEFITYLRGSEVRGLKLRVRVHVLTDLFDEIKNLIKDLENIRLRIEITSHKKSELLKLLNHLVSGDKDEGLLRKVYSAVIELLRFKYAGIPLTHLYEALSILSENLISTFEEHVHECMTTSLDLSVCAMKVKRMKGLLVRKALRRSLRKLEDLLGNSIPKKSLESLIEGVKVRFRIQYFPPNVEAGFEEELVIVITLNLNRTDQPLH